MNKNFIVYLALMAGVTYLIRMLPLVLIKKKIENKFILSFLYYMPYTVLSAMTIPAIFYSTGNVLSAALGFFAAVVVAYREKSLLTVATVSCIVVFIAELLINF